MLNKPSNWDQVEDFRQWEPLELGGHYLQIIGVAQKPSKSGRDMLVIQYDTADNDIQPKYFTSNHEEGRYYQGTYYIVLGEEEWAVRNLKALITSAEKSNSGFAFDWNNPNCLRGKRIGGVFREEEYINDKGERKMSVKLAYLCSTDSVEGAKVPKPRLLDANARPSDNTGYLAGDSESNLPFDL